MLMYILFTILGIIALGAYFFPTMLAFIIKSEYKRYVFFINLFLGWTFLGWCAALVISFADSKRI